MPCPDCFLLEVDRSTEDPDTDIANAISSPYAYLFPNRVHGMIMILRAGTLRPSIDRTVDPTCYSTICPSIDSTTAIVTPYAVTCSDDAPEAAPVSAGPSQCQWSPCGSHPVDAVGLGPSVPVPAASVVADAAEAVPFVKGVAAAPSQCLTRDVRGYSGVC